MATKKPMRHAIRKKVINTLAEYFNISAEKISPQARLIEDLGVDSFGIVELRFELKKKMGIDLIKEDFQKIVTVNDIISYIENYAKNR